MKECLQEEWDSFETRWLKCPCDRLPGKTNGFFLKAQSFEETKLWPWSGWVSKPGMGNFRMT